MSVPTQGRGSTGHSGPPSPELPSQDVLAGRPQVRPVWALAGIVLLMVATWTAWVQAPYPHPLRPHAERGWLDLVRYPVELNPARRLPSAPGAMYGVAVLGGGKTAWAVGAGGTVLVTRDGGRRWEAKPSGVRADLWGVHFDNEGVRGWIVGAGGTVLATENGGDSWGVQSVGKQADFFALHVSPDGKQAWIAGSAGMLLVTRDAGRSWSAIEPVVGANLFGVHFSADGRIGWAVGESATLLRTVDRGVTWTIQATGLRGGLRDVHASADGMRVRAVGGQGLILSSDDGGDNWSSQVQGNAALTSTRFSDDGKRAWIFSDLGDILASEDGGRTWSAQASGVHASLRSARFSRDGLRGWVVGSGGTILSTEDAGRQWTVHATAVGSTVYALHVAPDGQHAWGVGSGGAVVATRDGGVTWRPQHSGTDVVLQGVHFADDHRRGWAVGSAGTILATVDSGDHWVRQPSKVEINLRAMHFHADGLRGWVVGDGGTVLATVDGGANWTIQANGLTGTLYSVAFDAEGRTGLAVGVAGGVSITLDGGRHWSTRHVEGSSTLYAVHLDADGRRNWIVGDNGLILSGGDLLADWAAQSSGVAATLYAVRFGADGRRGWAVGSGGIILTTSDGGARWRSVESTVGSSRLAVAVARDARQVWVGGYPPALQRTADAGAAWSIADWPVRYVRYPAPWYGFALLGAIACWWLALRRRPPITEPGAEALAVTDAPTKEFSQDRLRFGPLAKGISRFLRNAATEPPLTLAISGHWGSGKSSLMGLVCSDLRRHGHHPVWFNAWHHQKDEHLLAALLDTVRNQGLPSTLTPDGLIFRLRLLWLRSKKHFVLSFLLLSGITAGFAFFATHETDAWRRAWAVFGAHLPWIQAAAAGDMKGLTGLDLGKLLAQVASGLTILVALRKALTAFGADPAVLLSATAEQFRLKDASAVTGFRARFATQFEEVTACLPYRMVIVIDDLDRCRSEAVLEVMEAVNFLVSSGSCIVMFGMATSRVQAALAVSFEKIASESVELAIKPGDTPTPLEKERMERERRRSYARDYMEKLINLEIVVPDSGAVEPHALFQAVPDRGASIGSRVAALLGLWPFALVVGAVMSGWHAGTRWTVPDAPPATVMAVDRPASVAPSVSMPAATAQRPQVPSVVVPSTYAVPTVQPGDNRVIPWVVFVIPLGVLVAWAAGFALVRLRASVARVEDSDAFKRALRVWTRLVRLQRDTPRGLKRFGNRIRYLAMLHQAERFDRTRLDTVRAAVAARLARIWPGWSGPALAPASMVTPPPVPVRIGDDTIVALGAIYEVCGEEWRKGVAGEAATDKLGTGLALAIEQFKESGSTWPPGSAELDAFERSLKGVRVPSS